MKKFILIALVVLLSAFPLYAEQITMMNSIDVAIEKSVDTKFVMDSNYSEVNLSFPYNPEYMYYRLREQKEKRKCIPTSCTYKDGKATLTLACQSTGYTSFYIDYTCSDNVKFSTCLITLDQYVDDGIPKIESSSYDFGIYDTADPSSTWYRVRVEYPYGGEGGNTERRNAALEYSKQHSLQQIKASSDTGVKLIINLVPHILEYAKNYIRGNSTDFTIKKIENEIKTWCDSLNAATKKEFSNIDINALSSNLSSILGDE